MELLAVITSFLILGLIGVGCLPARFANSNAKVLRRFVTWLIGIECALASVLAISHIATGGAPLSISLADGLPGSGASIGIYFDGLTSLMLLLVSFVGFVVSQYSIRYLDGEAMQGRYFSRLGFTIAAVSLMIVSGNLLMFFLAWVMTSFGLHQLLLHYRHRPAAHRAAWTKFTISRIGDAFLIAAVLLTLKTFGTLELSELFAAARELAAESQVAASHVAIGWLLVLGAITKSTQFPFHTWLPDTMETPTPVSALMHAGVVNAGGYLIIRMSPLVALAPTALAVLAVVGAFTACFAGVVMMTQPSVKRALAYSTIAQMGFMMLQCGLGAFSAAMLHIIVHSLYKAHAFLSSGSVVSEALATSGAKSPTPSARMNFAYLLAAAGGTVLAYSSMVFAFGIDLTAKPGGLVLAFILCLALTTWGWRLFTLGEPSKMFFGLASIAGLCFAYVASFLAVDYLVGPSIADVYLSSTLRFVFFDVAIVFCVLFALHVIVIQRLPLSWLAPLRVHASNGFYIDAIYYRIFASLQRN